MNCQLVLNLGYYINELLKSTQDFVYVLTFGLAFLCKYKFVPAWYWT